jgi:hypothetical protein
MQPIHIRSRLTRFTALGCIKYSMKRHGLEFRSSGSETFDMFRAESVVTEHLKLFTSGDEDLASVFLGMMNDGGVEHLKAVISDGFVGQMATGLNPKGLEEWTMTPSTSRQAPEPS